MRSQAVTSTDAPVGATKHGIMTDMIVTARLRANHEPDLVAMAEDPTAHMGIVLKDCIKAFFTGDRDFMVIARPRGGRCRAKVVTVRCRLNWKKDAECIAGIQAITKPAMKNKFYRRLLAHYVTVDESAYQNYQPGWDETGAEAAQGASAGATTGNAQEPATPVKSQDGTKKGSRTPAHKDSEPKSTDSRRAGGTRKQSVAKSGRKSRQTVRDDEKPKTKAKAKAADQTKDAAAAAGKEKARQKAGVLEMPAPTVTPAQAVTQGTPAEAPASQAPAADSAVFDPFAAFDDLF